MVILSYIMCACQEEIFVDVNFDPGQIVIEGVVTNNALERNVTISRATNYYDPSEVPEIIDDAVVTITTNDVITDTLRFNNVTQTYQAPALSVFSDGVYTLDVYYDGNHYRATETARRSVLSDTLYARINDINPFLTDGYYAFYDVDFIQEGDHYLRLKYSVNGVSFKEPEFYAFIDSVTPGSTSFEIPILLTEGNVVRVASYSLSKDVYTYFEGFLDILTNDGGIISSPPVNPQTNIINLTQPDKQPYGYFQVSLLTTNTIVFNQINK